MVVPATTALAVLVLVMGVIMRVRVGMVVQRRRGGCRLVTMMFVAVWLVPRDRAVRMMIVIMVMCMIVFVMIMPAATAVMVMMGMIMPMVFVPVVIMVMVGVA